MNPPCPQFYTKNVSSIVVGMVDRVKARMTRAELKRQLLRIPAILAGKQADPQRVAMGVQLRVGVACLSQIQQAFITKSRGGVGSDGIKWPPLKPSTIAQRRTSASERKSLGITGKRVRGLLTPSQDKRWRAIYGSRLARFRMHMSEGEARARAAQIAWAVLKSEGAKTKIGTLGKRQVDILRDTSELFRSLSPGVGARPSGADGQIFDVNRVGCVIVGTNKKPWHHRGVPGRLPQRALWPVDGSIPDPWWPPIIDAAKTGVMEVAQAVARGRA